MTMEDWARFSVPPTTALYNLQQETVILNLTRVGIYALKANTVHIPDAGPDVFARNMILFS